MLGYVGCHNRMEMAGCLPSERRSDDTAFGAAREKNLEGTQSTYFF
jgi:hypothetical protein